MTRPLHILLIATLTILADVCQAPAAQTPSAQAPEWLSTRPAPTGYLVGIASAQIQTSQSAAENEALAAALATLAAQLSVDLTEQTSQHRHEVGQVFTDQFESDRKMISALRLEGVEIVDRYDDGRRVWVYARVHEATLRQTWQRRAEATAIHLQQQQDLLRDPETHEARALRAGLQALASASAVDGSGNAPAVQHDVKQQVLADLCQRLADLELRPRRDAHTIGIDVRRHGSMGFLGGLPLRLRSGGREILLWTDARGMVRTPVSVFGTQSPMTIDVCLDLQALAGTVVPSEELPLPTTKINVTRRSRRVLLTGQERYFGQQTELRSLRPELVTILRQAGVDIVADGIPAQQIIDIDANAYRGTQVGDLAFAWLDLTITVSDARTGIVLYRGHRRDIKGAGGDHDGAVAAALRQATDLLREAVFTTNERDSAHVDSMGASLHP